MTGKNKIKKLISGILIILILLPAILFSSPKKTDAFWGIGDVPIDASTNIVTGVGTQAAVTEDAAANTASLGLKIKDVAIAIGRELLKAAAKKVLAQMTKSTINWINSGFHGQPLFLENPDSFFRDVAKSELKDIVNIFGYNSLLYPFGKQFALNAINSYKSQLAINAQYSLSNVMNGAQLRLYLGNFNYGGWNGFLTNTQYPQNNYLGFNMIATEELARRVRGTVQTAAEKVKTTLDQGMGFLSPETCPSNPEYNNGVNEFQRPSFDASSVPYTCVGDEFSEDPAVLQAYITCKEAYDANLQDAKDQFYTKNTCPGGLVKTTPGYVAANQVTNALNMPGLTTALDGAMGNSLAAIFDALIQHFLDKGLNSLASKVNSASADDNWSYNGLTLGGPTTVRTGAKTDWSSGPDITIILNDFKKKIGGYFIGTCSNIKNSDGILIPDQKDISKAQCDSKSIPANYIGTCINIKDASGNPLIDEINISEAECNAKTGTWTKNPAGKDFISGNTTVWIRNSTGQDFISGDIDNTTAELKLMHNDDPINPGIYQIYGKIWPKAQKLDECIPGPDTLNLHNRLDNQVEQISASIHEKTHNDFFGSLGTVTRANGDTFSRDLASAVNAFKEWLDDKTIMELPSSQVYMDSINKVTTLSGEMNDLNRNIKEKKLALLRMQSIKTNLDAITTQPIPGSNQEKLMISLWRQYQGIAGISNTTTLEETRNTLYEAKDIYNELVDSLNPNNPLGCPAERTAKGWGNPGGPSSVLSSNGKTEMDLFCVDPTNNNDPELPTLNKPGAFTYASISLDNLLDSLTSMFDGGGDIFGGGGSGVGSPAREVTFDIILDCNNIYNASFSDYKGNLPGIAPQSSAGVVYGNCKDSNGFYKTNTTKEQCDINSGTFLPLEPLGTCIMPALPTTPIPDTPQSACTVAGGTWTVNVN